MDEKKIRSRITDLRLKKGVSEYQMSLELGQSKGYIQNIISGRSLPSMRQFLNICEYFNITPLEFFNSEISPPIGIKSLVDEIMKLPDSDIEMLFTLVKRLSRDRI